MKMIRQSLTHKAILFLALTLCSAQIIASAHQNSLPNHTPLLQLLNEASKKRSAESEDTEGASNKRLKVSDTPTLVTHTRLSQLLDEQAKARSAQPTDAENPTQQSTINPKQAAEILAGLNASAASSSSSKNKKKCPVPNCKETFVSGGGLKNHAILHQDNGLDFKCTACSLFFARYCALTKHCNKYGCSIEKQEQESSSSSSSAQEKTTRPTFKCSAKGCNKSYLSEKSLKDHFKVRHSENPKRFSCEKCSASYRDRKGLLNHAKLHSPSNGQFACNKCNMFYVTNQALTLHTSKHHKTNPAHNASASAASEEENGASDSN